MSLRGPQARTRDIRRAVQRPTARWLALLGIVLLALGLRAAVYLAAPKPIDGAGLAAEQAEVARNIVDHGRWFVVDEKSLELIKKRQAVQGQLVDPARIDFSQLDRRPSYEPEIRQMPGLAVVLAGLWWVSGQKTYTALQWLQILIDAAMVLLVYWIALRLTSSVLVGMLSAFLYAIWPGAIVVAKRPVLDTWTTFFLIASVAAFVWARERPATVWRLVPLGLLTGLGIYFRPFIAILPVMLAAVAAPAGWSKRVVWALVPTAIALALLAPWTIRNYSEFHRFIPTRTGVGQALYEGVGGAPTDEVTRGTVRRARPTAAYGGPEYDDFLIGTVKQAILDNPRWYFRLVVQRARFLIPCLLVFLVWRRWRLAGLVLGTTALATIGPYLFIGDDTRFYLPAAFAYLILGSMGAVVALSHLSNGLRAGRRRGVVTNPEPAKAELTS